MVADCPRSGSALGSWDTRDVTSQPQPTAKPAKPRLLQDGRDMFWSIVPLVVACIVLAGMVGMCTFAPGGTNRGTVPSYDAAGALRADAQTLGFPVRLPRLPAGWQPNSGSRGDIESGRTDPSTGQRLRAVTSTVGYISPTGMYLSLTQSDADEDKLVGSIHPSAYPTDTVDVDGTRWIVYQSESSAEPMWTTRLDSPAGPAQIAIAGAGSVDQFRILAAATQSQPPLPSKKGP
ncbi:DUF4245 domain-containing protein [Mycobacterium fragae]|uniref:DUF4245 domain-containing protein n=1 Tax=Mycobacterium fragae TaxID=1260918 RepID=A0A1X1V611_9MYCO|nr:DUF4245 domain-containing protein [Mycobacterium fragae]ORV64514.1 hypothetical protein AWC06_05375 [Mycobacterium fragae]